MLAARSHKAPAFFFSLFFFHPTKFSRFSWSKRGRKGERTRESGLCTARIPRRRAGASRSPWHVAAGLQEGCPCLAACTALRPTHLRPIGLDFSRAACPAGAAGRPRLRQPRNRCRWTAHALRHRARRLPTMPPKFPQVRQLNRKPAMSAPALRSEFQCGNPCRCNVASHPL